MIRALVTALGGGGHGDQIIKALRLAPSNRYTIIGADANPKCPQAKLVDHFVTLPFASSPDYLTTLLSVCKEYRIDALFHGCEPELLTFSSNSSIIRDEGIFLPINAPELIDLCMDKARTNARLAELGFPAPKYTTITSLHQCDSIDWFPVVVKPSTGGGGSANVYIAQDLFELRSLLSYLGVTTSTQTFLVQEYVGTPDEEYTVGVLHDLDGNYINSIALRRHLKSGLSVRTSCLNRTSRTDLGTKLVISSGVSQGDIGSFEEITTQCTAIANSLGSRGPLNFQCRFVDGKVSIFEINPRFSGTSSMRAMVGFNEPDLLIRHHILGHDLTNEPTYREATIYRSLLETLELNTPISK